MSGKRLLKLGALAACAALAVTVAGSAGAAEVRYGTLILRADGGFQPNVLPRGHRVPIRFQGHADILTTDGSAPPALNHVKLEFDRDGKLNTAGLPACRPNRIEATTSNQAEQRCGGAQIGEGHVGAVISLGAAQVKVRSPLLLFNGPRISGNQTVIAHAQTSVPIFQSYVVVAPIERRRGTFGYRTSFDVPPIAGGLGALTHVDAKIGREFRRGGTKRSYVTARCSDGILQTQGFFRFSDGKDTVISGSVFKPCSYRG
jgi:hypothetical protein